MSFIGGMAGFFGLSPVDAKEKARIRGEIDMFAAISAHVKWKVRLQEYINGVSKEVLDPMVICCDDQCTLGKWIHGSGLKHFYMDEVFHQLRADHAKFHVIAGNVVKHVQANERDAAKALMDSGYNHISHKVVHALTELNQHLNE